MGTVKKQRLRECFAEALNVSPEIVSDTFEYQSIPAWDSAAHMALVATIEEDFDIMLDTDDIIAMSSVGKAFEILSKYGVCFEDE